MFGSRLDLLSWCVNNLQHISRIKAWPQCSFVSRNFVYRWIFKKCSPNFEDDPNFLPFHLCCAQQAPLLKDHRLPVPMAKPDWDFFFWSVSIQMWQFGRKSNAHLAHVMFYSWFVLLMLPIVVSLLFCTKERGLQFFSHSMQRESTTYRRRTVKVLIRRRTVGVFF